MLRTRKTRPVGGALVLILVVVVSLLAGALGVSAQAEDGSDPGAGSTTSAQPETATATDGSDTSSSTTTESAPVRDLVGPAPAVQRAYLPVALGHSASLDLRRYVTCPANNCTYLRGTAPSGWPYSVTTAGLLTVKVPKKTVPRSYNLTYSVTNGVQPATGTVTIQVTPTAYTPGSRVVFTHPYRKHYRFKIRNRIVRTIDSVPPGERIQVASWSFSSRTYRKALKHAKRRGVVVQIVLAQRNRKKNSDYRLLKKAFGTTVTANGSWVKKCTYSCRGVSGTMHSKIFLFSKSYRTPYVSMTGSANLTDFAVTNQWNQMNVVVNNKPVYDDALRIFNEMVRDRRADPMYVQTSHGAITSYYYPSTGVSTANDFMYKALSHVHCTGARNTASGRTEIRIAMYAWYQQRGQWLAKKVRQLWQQGCKIQIVYAISSDPVKKILYAPSGRGRIPMRQILLTNRNFQPIYYLHDKWVAIKGNYGSNPRTWLSFQGSFNFSDLGFTSDENFQALSGSAYYSRFKKDFKLLWKDRQARAPSPISKIPTIEGRYSRDDLRLGTGAYRYMDAD